MYSFPPEVIKEKIALLTEPIREVFYSYDHKQLLFTICENYHLSEDRALGTARAFGYLLMGLIFPKDLPTQIVKEANIDPRVASEIAKEIDHKIILPSLAAELNKAYGFKMDVVDAPQPIQQATPPLEPESISAPVSTPTPIVKPEGTNIPIQPEPKPSPETPLVIHEHASQQPTLGDAQNSYPGGLVHPSFYTPDNVPTSNMDAPTARLEIGINTSDEPPTAKVGNEMAKVVHYEAPPVAPDPFSGQAKTNQPSSNQPNRVSPANVVNLKDLPQ